MTDANQITGKLIEEFYHDRFLAQSMLFRHRHPDESPEFHRHITRLWQSDTDYVLVTAFRGAAKSTNFEENTILDAIEKRFTYGIVIGNTYERAVERLTSIKYELGNNDMIKEIYGDMVGPVWAEGAIVLSNGVKIEAFGARQSLRGAKYKDARPDRAFIDDLEDEENVATKAARAKTMKWFMAALLPAMQPPGRRKIRMVGTPLHPDSCLENLRKDKAWTTRVFPIEYLDADGARTPMWPARFPLDAIDSTKGDYVRQGLATAYAQEYMCQAMDEDTKPFKPEQIHVQAMPGQEWLPTYVMVDPARSTNPKSARTGYAAWSWSGSKLLIRHGEGHYHKPSEIIDEIFKLDKKFRPVAIGVEKDGLEEFIMQPLREQMLSRHHMLPIEGLRAPKDKNGFITSLQPYFQSGDAVFLSHQPDLVAELLNFPAGLIDVLNALAYATKLRQGKPVYEDFTSSHIGRDLDIVGPRSFLAIQATGSQTVAVLLQFEDGTIRVIRDWVKDRSPTDALDIILPEAQVEAGNFPKVVVSRDHTAQYTNVGLVQALRKSKIQFQLSGSTVQAHSSLTRYMTQLRRGTPAFQVSSAARWTINALAGGYCYDMASNGTLGHEPKGNVYKLVAEALEAFASFVSTGVEGDDPDQHYETTGDGRRYLSAMVTRR